MYWISNHGRVLNTKTGRLLRPYQHKLGYCYVLLCNCGKRSNLKIHRLVAEAFIPNPCNYPEVNHIDEVKSNNVHSNLEWVTSQMNIEYSNSLQCTFIDPEGRIVEVTNVSKFAKENNLTPSGLRLVWHESYSQYKGWRKYKPGMKLSKFNFNSYTFRNPQGEEVTTSNIAKLATEFNLDRSSLSRVQAGRARNHKGWTCPGVKFIGR